MIDSDTIRAFQTQAITTKHIEIEDNLYGLVRRLERQFGERPVDSAIDFLMGLMVEGRRIENVKRALYSASKKNSIRMAHPSTFIELYEAHWVPTGDLGALRQAIVDFRGRSGKAARITKEWDDMELEKELEYLSLLMSQWEYFDKLGKCKDARRRLQIIENYRSTMNKRPVAMMKILHEERVEKIRERSRDGK